jgi:hypothetical protein
MGATVARKLSGGKNFVNMMIINDKIFNYGYGNWRVDLLESLRFINK